MAYNRKPHVSMNINTNNNNLYGTAASIQRAEMTRHKNPKSNLLPSKASLPKPSRPSGSRTSISGTRPTPVIPVATTSHMPPASPSLHRKTASPGPTTVYDPATYSYSSRHHETATRPLSLGTSQPRVSSSHAARPPSPHSHHKVNTHSGYNTSSLPLYGHTQTEVFSSAAGRPPSPQSRRKVSPTGHTTSSVPLYNHTHSETLTQGRHAGGSYKDPHKHHSRSTSENYHASRHTSAEYFEKLMADYEQNKSVSTSSGSSADQHTRQLLEKRTKSPHHTSRSPPGYKYPAGTLESIGQQGPRAGSDTLEHAGRHKGSSVEDGGSLSRQRRRDEKRYSTGGGSMKRASSMSDVSRSSSGSAPAAYKSATHHQISNVFPTEGEGRKLRDSYKATSHQDVRSSVVPGKVSSTDYPEEAYHYHRTSRGSSTRTHLPAAGTDTRQYRSSEAGTFKSPTSHMSSEYAQLSKTGGTAMSPTHLGGSTVSPTHLGGPPSSPTHCRKTSLERTVKQFSPRVHNYLEILRKNRSDNSTRSPADLETAYLNKGKVGLINTGNTCYMNCMIQCLSHTIEMTDIVLCNTMKDCKVYSAYKKAMHDIWLPQKESYSISKYGTTAQHVMDLRTLQKSLGSQYPQYCGFGQQDAQEFLSHLISSLHQEMRSPSSDAVKMPSDSADISDHVFGEKIWKWQESVDCSAIAKVFMGQFKSCVQCLTCRHVSRVFEPFWQISLSIRDCEKAMTGSSIRLKDCLRYFTRIETMGGDDKPFCQRCKRPQKSSKQMTVQRFPSVLVMCLKRFEVSKHGFHRKLESRVEVPICVDMTPFASPETVSEDFKGQRIKYELYGVAHHRGTLYSGHYTAEVQHFAEQQWYSCNDQSIRRQEMKSGSFISETAYVLFYRRQADC